MSELPVIVDGKRLRSRLNWLILKTLALDVGVPLSIANVTQFLYEISSRTPGQMLRRRRFPNLLSVYLWRLAERGYVKIEGLKYHRTYTLSARGRRELRALEALYGREGPGLKPEAGGRLADLVKAVRKRRLARMLGQKWLAQEERRAAKLQADIPGRPRVHAFISYDLPQKEGNRRRQAIAILKNCGYQRLHQSMYTGPSQNMRVALEALEGLGILPHLRWGTLTVYSP